MFPNGQKFKNLIVPSVHNKCVNIWLSWNYDLLNVQENFGRQEQHLEQHYNDVLQTLSQRYDERAAGLEEEKKSKLESLYGQLLVCGQALDASKELIEKAQEIYRCQDKRLFLKVPSLGFFCTSFSLL